MSNEERKEFYMNRNIKLYPFYISITWDMLFVWTILTMYYIQFKGLSASQAILLDSVQTLSACIMCIPITKYFAKMKPVKASRIGNMGYFFCLLFILIGNNMATFALAHICLGFAYDVFIVKNMSILNQSLHAVDRDKDYERVYGKGVSFYYVFESVSAILATYLYSWKPQAPIVAALVVVVIAQIYSFLLKEPVKFQPKNASINPRTSYKERKARQPDKFIKILSSGFVICLLFYAFIIRGAMSMDTSQFRLYLQGLTETERIPVWAFGYIFAFMRVCTALASRYQFKFNLKFGVRSLIIFESTYFITTISAGLIYAFMPENTLKMMLIIVLMICTCVLRAPNSIFLNNYLQVCSPEKNHEKMYALRTIAEYLGYACCNAFYAQLLSSFNNNLAYSAFVFVGVLAIPLIAALMLFIRALTKKFAQRYTIIKPEYTEEE